MVVVLVYKVHSFKSEWVLVKILSIWGSPKANTYANKFNKMSMLVRNSSKSKMIKIFISKVESPCGFEVSPSFLRDTDL